MNSHTRFVSSPGIDKARTLHQVRLRWRSDTSTALIILITRTDAHGHSRRAHGAVAVDTAASGTAVGAAGVGVGVGAGAGVGVGGGVAGSSCLPARSGGNWRLANAPDDTCRMDVKSLIPFSGCAPWSTMFTSKDTNECSEKGSCSDQ
jgi:hypothetical protein